MFLHIEFLFTGVYYSDIIYVVQMIDMFFCLHVYILAK